jgi:hypothetical protein
MEHSPFIELFFTLSFQNLKVNTGYQYGQNGEISEESPYLMFGAIQIIYDFIHKVVYAIGIFMEPIKAQFILNPEEDQDATGHSYSKASNIYKGIAFMSRQISECNFYVVFNHGFILFWDFVIGRHNFALEDTLIIIL